MRAADIDVLGDDDPEHNIPFSVERTKDRPETEEELGQRMVEVARSRRADVITGASAGGLRGDHGYAEPTGSAGAVGPLPLPGGSRR